MCVVCRVLCVVWVCEDFTVLFRMCFDQSVIADSSVVCQCCSHSVFQQWLRRRLCEKNTNIYFRQAYFHFNADQDMEDSESTWDGIKNMCNYKERVSFEAQQATKWVRRAPYNDVTLVSEELHTEHDQPIEWQHMS